MLTEEPNIPIQKLKIDFLAEKGIELFVKREDLLHPEISGNKWRKLKYNIQAAKSEGKSQIITFGGAYSNHIAATAAAGKLHGLETLGVLRGEEVLPLNPTLKLAQENGMKFKYVSRSDYRNKDKNGFLESIGLSTKDSYVIPEGGANLFGLKGCQEILQNCESFDLIVVACGTANTFSGISSKLRAKQKSLGFPVLKNAGFLEDEVRKNLGILDENKGNWSLNLDYHFGGYAKQNSDLIHFLQDFWENHNIKLDPIYTGKAMFGLLNELKTGGIEAEKILFIHTGGLQGIEGFEKRYKMNLYS